jgi:hypothetical protein
MDEHAEPHNIPEIAEHGYPCCAKHKSGFNPALDATTSGLMEIVLQWPAQGACMPNAFEVGFSLIMNSWREHRDFKRKNIDPLTTTSSNQVEDKTQVCLVLDTNQPLCMDLENAPVLHQLLPGCHHLEVWLQNADHQVTSGVSSAFFEVEFPHSGTDNRCLRLNCGKTSTKKIWNQDDELAAISAEKVRVQVSATGETSFTF